VDAAMGVVALCIGRFVGAAQSSQIFAEFRNAKPGALVYIAIESIT